MKGVDDGEHIGDEQSAAEANHLLDRGEIYSYAGAPTGKTVAQCGDDDDIDDVLRGDAPI